MELEHPFLQLPLQFDDERLKEEIKGFNLYQWTGHPSGLPGNAALVLVSVGGFVDSDEFARILEEIGAEFPPGFLDDLRAEERVNASPRPSGYRDHYTPALRDLVQRRDAWLISL